MRDEPCSCLPKAPPASLKAPRVAAGVSAWLYRARQWPLRQLGGGHPRQDGWDLAVETARIGVALVIAGIGRHRRQPRRLRSVEVHRAHAEIAARRRLAPEHAVSPLDDVQIKLEDPPLVEERLQHQRDERLLAFAPVASLRREKEILRELLRNGRAAGDNATAAEILV